MKCFSQMLQITAIDQSKISTTIVDSTAKSQLLINFDGQQDNSLRKKWTARTFVLSDGKIVLEFYDRQGLLINSLDDFKKLENVRFLKNTVWFLKKNISYKIELPFEEAIHLINTKKPKRLEKYEMPDIFNYKVYELNTGQILFIDHSDHHRIAAIYPDLKSLSSDYNTIEEKVYSSDDDEYVMRKLAGGDPLLDYEPNEHLFYPKYEKDLIKNHKLNLIETKVFVDSFFYGNLYQSKQGYYILLDDFNQLNLKRTKKIEIGQLRVYKNIDEVRTAQKLNKDFNYNDVTSEHFYQKISDTYGEKFPEKVDQLIEQLPTLLNFDKEQLSLNSEGIDLIDEAVKWNSSDNYIFDFWFPPLLAFYGKVYINEKKEGRWKMLYDSENKVWIPEVILTNGLPAGDWRNFYKDLYEGPISLKWAGNWE